MTTGTGSKADSGPKEPKRKPRKKPEDSKAPPITQPPVRKTKLIQVTDLSESMDDRLEMVGPLLEAGMVEFKGPESDIESIGMLVFCDTVRPCPNRNQFQMVPIADAVSLNTSALRELSQHGNTALVDAILRAIEEGKDLKNVRISAFTDGVENKSKAWSRDPASPIRGESRAKVVAAIAVGMEISITGFVTDSEATALRDLAQALGIPDSNVELHTYVRGNAESLSRATQAGATSYTQRSMGRSGSSS